MSDDDLTKIEKQKLAKERFDEMFGEKYRWAEVEYKVLCIPDGDYDDEEFRVFCDHLGIHPLGSERRGWFPAASSYLRNATHVVFCDNGGMDLGYEGEGLELIEDD